MTYPVAALTSPFPRRADVVDSAVSHRDEITDAELWHDMVFGMIVGTPLIWLLSVAIALPAGVGLGNAAAIGIVPGLFCGVFYGGIIPLMGRLIRAERSDIEHRLAQSEPPTTGSFGQAA